MRPRFFAGKKIIISVLLGEFAETLNGHVFYIFHLLRLFCWDEGDSASHTAILEAVPAVLCLVALSCLTLCDPCPWGFSRKEYCSGLPCPPPGGSSQARDQTQVSHIAGWFLTVWATREAPFLLSALFIFSLELEHLETGQDLPSQNTPLWYIDYPELKSFEKHLVNLRRGFLWSFLDLPKHRSSRVNSIVINPLPRSFSHLGKLTLANFRRGD